MRGDPISVSLLGLRMLPNADPILRKHLNLRPEDRSLGFLTTDCDDVSYTALDEATKKADVHVAYRSKYISTVKREKEFGENSLYLGVFL